MLGHCWVGVKKGVRPDDYKRRQEDTNICSCSQRSPRLPSWIQRMVPQRVEGRGGHGLEWKDGTPIFCKQISATAFNAHLRVNICSSVTVNWNFSGALQQF